VARRQINQSCPSGRRGDLICTTSDEPDLFSDRIHIEQIEISVRGKTIREVHFSSRLSRSRCEFRRVAAMAKRVRNFMLVNR
jgi:hypothetical protein